MTKGNVYALLIEFAIPLLLGNLFQQLYNTVDTWVVGNYVGKEAFSAVGTVNPIINMLIGFFMGLSVGAGVVISQYYGAKQLEKVSDTVHTALVMTAVLGVVFTAIGVSIILQNVAMMGWGRNYLNFPQVLSPRVFEIFGARMSTLQIAIVAIAALIMGGLLAVVHKTRLGTAMRATAQNREVAGLMGVNINTVISAAFLIGSALAAVAGMMVATYYGVSQYTMGFMLGLKAFTAAVLGGIGNLVGAMAGGLLLGIIESLGAGYIGDLTGGFLGSHYQDVFAFFVLVLVLIFRPSGLLGERVGDRA